MSTVSYCLTPKQINFHCVSRMVYQLQAGCTNLIDIASMIEVGSVKMNMPFFLATLCPLTVHCCVLKLLERLKVCSPPEELYLTPYIEKESIQEGRNKASVWLGETNVTSYSGFLTVNKDYNSNIFFWFFPAIKDPEGAPVVLWLQGGPGESSLFGLFKENGPFYVNEDLRLEPREHSWSKVFNLLYIDNPVGTGFSFTESEEGYPKDEISVGRDLFEALGQFYRLFPYLRSNDFYATGESYAGKYVSALCYAIHLHNLKNKRSINLRGMAVGNGWMDPESMMLYGNYLYQVGLIDSKAKLKFNTEQNKIITNIKQKNYLTAYKIYSSLILNQSSSLFHNETGFSSFNIMNDRNGNLQSGFEFYIQTTFTRKLLHVGSRSFQNGAKSRKYLLNDIMQSVKHWIEIILENYKVLFFNGQLDIISSYPLTVNFMEKLNWSGADAYITADRNQWFVDKKLAGYSKSVKSFTEVLVLNSSSMVPHDQPKRAFDLITRFIFDDKI